MFKKLFDVPAQGIDIQIVVFRDKRGCIDTQRKWGEPIPAGDYWRDIEGEILQVVTIASLQETALKCYRCKAPFRPSQWIMWSLNTNPFQIMHIEGEGKWWAQQYSAFHKAHISINDLNPHPADRRTAAHWDCVKTRAELKKLDELRKKIDDLLKQEQKVFDDFHKAMN
ncbi:MAG: hypothetical protein U1B30_15840 [Pseudomonadota bacterium]|nr:hypothetical protein [Pseudomonadota bacterium]